MQGIVGGARGNGGLIWGPAKAHARHGFKSGTRALDDIEELFDATTAFDSSFLGRLTVQLAPSRPRSEAQW